MDDINAEIYRNALIPRRGLGALGKRLHAELCTIAYLGNSITAQKDSYRLLLHNNLVSHFRKIHKPVNAGIGGVGSLACAFLLDELVIRHQPALCFVECSAADSGGTTPSDAIGPAVEGIIRQLIAAGTGIIFLHMYRRSDMAIEKEKVLAIYETLADHYGIPSINLDLVISKQISSGNVHENEVFHDGIHTTFTGSVMMGQIIGSLVVNLAEQPTDFEPGFSGQLYELPYQHTMVMPVCEKMKEFDSVLVKKRYRDILEYVELRLEEKLTVCAVDFHIRAILIVADADSGVVFVENEGIIQRIQTWDEWCFIPRLQAIIFDKPVHSGSTFRVWLSDSDQGEKGASGAKNHHIRVGKNLKIIGFMAYSEIPVMKIKLFGG
jgi:hypothetical protein